jgi:hypothetical protein
MHFFHVIPLPRPRIGGAFVGVGVGGIDELVFSDPDPAEDAKHVRTAVSGLRTEARVRDGACVSFKARSRVIYNGGSSKQR